MPSTAVKNNHQNAGWAESLLRYLKEPMHWGLVPYNPIDDQKGLKLFKSLFNHPPPKKTAITWCQILALKKQGIVSSNSRSND